MDIVISVNNSEEVMILPVVPPDVEISAPWNNEAKDSISLGEITLIGLEGLKKVSVTSFFPVNKNYSFAKPGSEKDGRKYVEFFERWRKKRVPFRLVMTDKTRREVLNLPVTVDGFTHSFDKAGDIAYTLDFTEYRFVG